MKGLSRLLVILVSAVTLILVGAVGASASAKSLGTPNAVNTVVTLVSGHSNGPTVVAQTKTADRASAADKDNNGKDKEKGQCKPPKKAHKHGTPGHKHHPCGDQDDDTD